jgi:hypothetical protein
LEYNFDYSYAFVVIDLEYKEHFVDFACIGNYMEVVVDS